MKIILGIIFSRLLSRRRNVVCSQYILRHIRRTANGLYVTWHQINHSSSSPRNSETSTILDITIATSPTTSIVHTAPREVQLEGGRYNREARGYCHMRLPNGKRCLNRSISYFHDCSIRFGRRTYYCKKNVRDWFALHHDSLVCLPCYVLCLTRP